MKKFLRQALSVLLTLAIVFTPADVTALAAGSEAEEIPALRDAGHGHVEVRTFYGLKEIKGTGSSARIFENLDLRGAEYVKINFRFGGFHQDPEDEPYVGRYKFYCSSDIDLVDQNTKKKLAPHISVRITGFSSPNEYTVSFNCENGGAGEYPEQDPGTEEEAGLCFTNGS